MSTGYGHAGKAGSIIKLLYIISLVLYGIGALVGLNVLFEEPAVGIAVMGGCLIGALCSWMIYVFAGVFIELCLNVNDIREKMGKNDVSNVHAGNNDGKAMFPIGGSSDGKAKLLTGEEPVKNQWLCNTCGQANPSSVYKCMCCGRNKNY